jgi:hypothetical protein
VRLGSGGWERVRFTANGLAVQADAGPVVQADAPAARDAGFASIDRSRSVVDLALSMSRQTNMEHRFGGSVRRDSSGPILTAYVQPAMYGEY